MPMPVLIILPKCGTYLDMLLSYFLWRVLFFNKEIYIYLGMNLNPLGKVSALRTGYPVDVGGEEKIYLL